MKLIRLQVALATFFLMISLPVFSQDNSNRIITMLDYKRNPVDASQSFNYIESMWKEDSLWHVQIFTFPDRILLEDFYYKDSLRKEKSGMFLSFHKNGSLADSGFYHNNKREGDFFSWYEDGNQQAMYHYKNGLPYDTCVTWDINGQVSEVSVTDAEGNGISQQFYASGKLKVNGKLLNGQHAGKWRYRREDGTTIMDVEYVKDSILSTNCYDEKGQPKSGDCIFQKTASFPGGPDGWRKFLERNLNYPEEALRSKISGTVRVKFHVAKDGSLFEYEIVSSPDKSLSEEVIRLMKKSPKWEPAIQLNSPVIYRHIQSITFNLN
jgi:TonB family protein